MLLTYQNKQYQNILFLTPTLVNILVVLVMSFPDRDRRWMCMCMEIQQITDQNKPEENSFRSGILHVLELVLLAFHVPHLSLLLH